MQSMFRSFIVLAALGLFVVVGCKDGDKAAEGTDKKEGAAKTEEKKAATCEDGWTAFGKLYTDARTEKAQKAPEDIKKSVIAGIPEALEKMKDGWMKDCAKQSPEVVACLVASKTLDEAKKCRNK